MNARYQSYAITGRGDVVNEAVQNPCNGTPVVIHTRSIILAMPADSHGTRATFATRTRSVRDVDRRTRAG